MARSATTFAKGQVTNPKGRAPKTDVERAAEDYLRSRNLHSAQRLVASADGAYEGGDFKTAGGLYAAHLKFTLGEHIRTETRDVTDRKDPLEGLTLDELRALARAQMTPPKDGA